MESNPPLGFSANKFAALKEAHEVYSQQKDAFFADIVKTTTGKMNTLDIRSAIEWLAFVQDNPKAVTNTRYSVAEFAFKAEAHKFLMELETLETKDQGHSKALRDIISSDLRSFWTNAEDFYIDAAAENPVIKEKYKDLPTISPKRKSDTQIESDFKKLEARRNKKNSDNTDTKT